MKEHQIYEKVYSNVDNYVKILLVFFLICIISFLYLLYHSISMVQEIDEPTITTDMYARLDEYNVENDILELRGWGFCEDSSTIYQLMWSEGLLMTILAFLVCVLIHLQNKSKFLKILSFIPITFCLLPMINYNSHLIDLSNLTWCNTNQNNIGITVYNCYEIKYYIPFVIFSMVYVILLICIFYSLYPNKNAGLAIGVLVLGMIARGAMTISPTIWASNLRTFIYTYASIAICAFIIIQEIEKKIKTSQKDMLYYAIGVASSLSFIMIMLE